MKVFCSFTIMHLIKSLNFRKDASANSNVKAQMDKCELDSAYIHTFRSRHVNLKRN